jgi:hypothetical protein
VLLCMRAGLCGHEPGMWGVSCAIARVVLSVQNMCIKFSNLGTDLKMNQLKK